MFLRCEEDPFEMMVLDLQGSLSVNGSNFSNLQLGNLKFLSDTNVELEVGNHKLVGLVKKLETPYLAIDTNSGMNIEVKGIVTKIIEFHKAPVFIHTDLPDD
eukprot:TRINITY_DN1237_c0_g1_i1.p1 TRINITY_DN1237_c0_g1~~TRINITY_DN1237_c0_g1_i1.p1  ORF type:complete len:102 (+),score=36.11 TRINITY_DN1237_c0_g1_i1:64-369(+)